MGLEICPGSDFPIDRVEEIRAKSEARASDTRNVLLFLIVAAVLLSIAVAAWLGFRDGTFDEVRSVWDAAAFPLGYVLAEYFRHPP